MSNQKEKGAKVNTFAPSKNWPSSQTTPCNPSHQKGPTMGSLMFTRFKQKQKYPKKR